MILRQKFTCGVAAMAIAGLALAGCSQAPEGGGKDGDDKALDASANEINAKDRGEVGDGGDLRLTNNAFPANWNILNLDGYERNTTDMMEGMLYPKLYSYTADGEVVPNKNYTKRLDVVSEDPLVVEIELNEGMKWSDGTPIDYKSIENVFKTMDGSKEDYNIVSSEGYDQVKKIEKGDNDLTAKVTFKEPYADWKGLADVAPDSLVKSAEAFNESWVKEPKVTAGPYKIKKIDSKNKTVQAVPDDNWWGDKAPLDSVLITTIEDPSAAASSFQNGQLDAIETTVPAQYSVVKPMIDNGAELRRASAPDWSHITLNGEKGGPLADETLRQAVFKTLDREEIFLSVNSTMPYPKDTEQLNNRMLMTNQNGYKDTAGDRADADPAAGKKMLEDAGYEYDDSGKATKDGEPITLEYVYNDGSKTNEAVLPVVQENLKEIGVTVKEHKVPPTDLFAKYIDPGKYDMTLFGYVGNPFLSSGDSIWKTNGGQNFSNTGDKEVDKLLNKAAASTDEDERTDLMNQADDKLWDVAGVIPLWQSYDFFVVNPDLANYGAFGFESPDWTKIGYVKGSDKLK
ncbi:ABC transporter family substrate-binding protein [Brevibacterium sp. FAM 24630]|uniref:ABC transporter family substrate-binding protein n=1 Tax=Brevibacterium sp. FAM 24630 TaxID=3415680 RepID=UPI003C7ABB49